MAIRTNKSTGVSYDAFTVLGGNYNDTIDGSGTTTRNGTGKLIGIHDTNAKSTSGHDLLAGGNGDDTIYAGDGDDTIWGDSASNSDANDNGSDKLHGQGGNDTIHGGNGKDLLDGGTGNDLLFGGNGTDTLLGGDGGDTLTGGNGGDFLTGGVGADTFVYKATIDSPANSTGEWTTAADTIFDFSNGEGDKIDLSALNLQLTGSGPTRLTWNPDGTPAAHGVWTDGSFLFADTNGDLIADLVIKVSGVTGDSFIGVNHLPGAVADTADVVEDLSVNGNFGTNDGSDPDVGDTITYSVSGPLPTGFTLIDSSTGAWRFSAASYDSLAEDEELDVVVNYTRTDSFGATSSSTLTITITGTNDAPVLTGDLAARVDEGAAYTIAAADLGFTDPDDTAADVTFTITGPSNGVVQVGGMTVTSFTGAQLAAGAVSFVHDGSETTSASFSVSVEDGNEDSSTPVASTFNLMVNPVNDAPVLTGDLAARVDEGAAYTIAAADLGFTDPDDTAADVTFTITGPSNGVVQVGGMTVTSFTGAQLAAGAVSFVHDGSETTSASFSVSVEDGNEDSSTPVASTFNLMVNPVNDAPVLTGDLAARVDEGAAYTIAAADLGFTDPDDTAADVTFTITGPSNGVVQVGGMTVTSFTGAQLAAGAVSFVHDGSETTSASFSVSVEDGNEDSSTPVASTFNLMVNPVNDAPVLTGDLAARVDEGAAYTIAAADLGFTDPDDTAADVTFTITGPSNGVVQVGGMTVTSFTGAQLAAGAVSFVHDGSETTSASFSVSVEDGNEDSSTPVASTFNLMVNPVNDAPVLTGDLAARVDEGAAYTIAAADLGFTDPDDTAADVTFTITGPSNGVVQVGGMTVTSFTGAQLAAGAVSFVHDGSETTSASFSVSVEDGNEDSSTPVASTFNLMVNPVNDAPVLTGDLAARVDEGAAYTIAAADLGFTDPDDTAADVTFTITGPSNGVVQVGGMTVTSFTGAQLAAGAVSFVHDGSETTSASFSVSVEDGNEDSSTPVASTFNLMVNPVNDAPVLTGDLAARVDEGAAYTIAAADLGFTDPDDTAADVTFTITGPSNGVVQVGGMTVTSFTGAQLAAGAVSFVHDGSETTSASFSVSVEDGNEDSSTPVASTFNLMVNPVNDAPVGVNDSYSTAEDTALVVAAAGVLANDTDVENSTLNAVLVSGPANGSLTLNANGSFTYTPNANYSGTDSFTYRPNDGSANGNVTTVNLTVTAVADATVIAGLATGSVTEDLGPSLAGGTLTATDPDGPATFIAQTGTVGTYGSFTIGENGVWSYQLSDADPDTNALNNGDVQHDIFTVTSNDGSTSTVDVTINGHNDAVVAYIKFLGGANEFDSGSTTSKVVGLFVAYDADGNVVPGASFTSTLPANSSLVLSSNGTLTANSVNTGSIDFSVSSGAATEQVHFQVGGNAAGGDNIDGTEKLDILLGVGGNDNLSGGTNNDALFGGGGANQSDILMGDGGDDFLSGGEGRDFLNGGAGADTLHGGTGADVFIWSTAADSKSNSGANTFYDKVTDFQTGVDKLDLSAIDANTINAAGTNDTFTIRTDGSSGANSVWWINSGGVTTVYGDTDGNAATVEFQIQLTNGATPIASDFIP